MPNHVTNILKIQADKKTVRSILKRIKSDEIGLGSIDFNKIIPMPESLNIESGSRSNKGLEIYRAYLGATVPGTDTENPDPKVVGKLSAAHQIQLAEDSDLFRLGKQCYENIREYGHADWYSWSIANYGTKWNSYGYDDFPKYQEGSDMIKFLTAWSPPYPVLEKLSEMYPDVTFSHQWADEDFGHNVGEIDYYGGESINENIPDGGSTEAFRMATDIMDIKLDSEESGYYLSADESGYVYADNDEYELIELFGKPALFTNERITAGEIPKGLYCYDLRHTDDGDRFAAIEPHVTVNHAGSVITNFPVDFGDAGYIELSDENSPNFLGESITLLQYMGGDFGNEQNEEQNGGLEL